MSDKEKLVHWMMKRGYATGHGDTMEDLLRELAWQMDERIERAVEKEREECARVCEEGIDNSTEWDSSYWDQACENRAFAIRERGRRDHIYKALDKLNKAAEDNGEEL